MKQSAFFPLFTLRRSAQSGLLYDTCGCCKLRILGWAILVLVFADVVTAALAGGVFSAGDSAYHPSGLFSYKWVGDTGTEVHLVRLGKGDPELLFIKHLAQPAKPPICFSNAVVVVSSRGEIIKFDLSGEVIFSGTPAGFAGAAFSCGKLTADHIFVTEVDWAARRKRWQFFLHLLDVSGKELVTVRRVSIQQPKRIVRVGDEVVIIGPKTTKRLNVEKLLRSGSKGRTH